jgi:hypothetical protein
MGHDGRAYNHLQHRERRVHSESLESDIPALVEFEEQDNEGEARERNAQNACEAGVVASQFHGHPEDDHGQNEGCGMPVFHEFVVVVELCGTIRTFLSPVLLAHLGIFVNNPDRNIRQDKNPHLSVRVFV